MVSYWAWFVLVLIVVRGILEGVVSVKGKTARRHRYEFANQYKNTCWQLFSALNLTVFVIHCVLLSIFFHDTEMNSVNYWLYSMTIYYILQSYLVFLVFRQDATDEKMARYIIYFCFGALLFALAGLATGDFCASQTNTICDPTKDAYYKTLWPAQAVALVIYGGVDVLLWANQGTFRWCPDSLAGQGIQFAQPAEVPAAQYAGSMGGAGFSDASRPFNSA